MRLLVLLWLVACDQGAADKHPTPPTPAPDGDITCGKSTCHANQVCITEQAGHTCWRDRPDIGEYGTHAQYCEDLPAACHGTPSCKCTGWYGESVMCHADGRQITHMCM